MADMTSNGITTRHARVARRGALALAVATLLAASSLDARPRSWSLTLAQVDDETPLAPAQRGGGISLAQATAIAQSQFPGRVVRAGTVQVGDRTIHEIRILGEDGRTVRTVRIDAQTGSFL